MKVIKAVSEERGKLVSTFAGGRWKKEYAVGVETKPDTGYLFAYKDLKKARDDMGCPPICQFWLAEAEVVGKINHQDINVGHDWWDRFWKAFEVQLRLPRADYLLCSSITLVKVIN